MYEIKVRMINEEMAMKLLKPLGLGEPSRVEKGRHIYFSGEGDIRKVVERGGEHIYSEIKRQGTGFSILSEVIDEERLSELKGEASPKATLDMMKTIWEVNGVIVCLNVINDLGVFLEFQGEDFETLKKWPAKIGFSESHYLTRTYDELA